MTVLLTGGTGLVGTRLLPRLVEDGFECRALVRPGKDVPPGVIRVEGDILEPASLTEAVEGVQAIVHLAALFRTSEEELVWAVNVEGTSNLIAAAKKYAPSARFIMASTGQVYNMDSTHPGLEDDDVAPAMAYPASKVVAEKELKESGLNWSILRFSFVYGDRDGHLESLPSLAKRMQLHPALKFSMIHHRDVAEFVKLGLAGKWDGRIVNAADEAPLSVYEVSQLVGKPVTPSAEPLKNPWWGQVDTTLARSLGFHPSVATVWQAARQNAL